MTVSASAWTRCHPGRWSSKVAAGLSGSKRVQATAYFSRRSGSAVPIPALAAAARARKASPKRSARPSMKVGTPTQHQVAAEPDGVEDRPVEAGAAGGRDRGGRGDIAARTDAEPVERQRARQKHQRRRHRHGCRRGRERAGSAAGARLALPPAELGRQRGGDQ